jgi:transposase
MEGRGQRIRAVGARLFFLPNCSPDLNPIEMFFAKLKHGLRKAGTALQRGHLQRNRRHSSPGLSQ